MQGEPVALVAGPVNVEGLERHAVGEELLVALALAEGRLAELGDARCLQRLLDLGVRAKDRARSRSDRYKVMLASVDSQTPSMFSARSGL